MADTITQDGELVPTEDTRPRDVDIGAMVSLARAEIDIQISTARRYPRSLAVTIKRITECATLDEETAEECCYALIRKKKGQRQDDEENKPIEGPSIRMAEIAAQMYGNCRIDARVISVNRQEKYVEAEGIFHDLESNMASRATVRRRISTKGGYLFSDDMIVVTGNAACAIAKRNAILAGIPRGVTRPGYKAARAVIAGTIQTLGDNRAKVYKAFASYGVTPAQIHDLLGVAGEADIGTDHIALLRATFSSIKNGEATVNEVFAREKVGEGVADPLGAGDVKTDKAKTKSENADKKSTAPAQASGEASPGKASGAGVGSEHPAGHEAGHQPAAGADSSGAVTAKQSSAQASEPARDEAPAIGPVVGASASPESGLVSQDHASANGGEEPSRSSPPKESEAGAESAKASPATAEKGQDGRKAKGASAPVEDGKGKPAPASSDGKPPKTEAEYRAHVLAYVAAATNGADLKKLWNAERPMRGSMSITSEVLEEVKLAVKRRAEALEGGGQ